MTLNWTDQELVPQTARPRGSVARIVAELQTQPGRWAEIDRYPADRAQTARVRGATTKHRYPQVQYALDVVDDEVVLYFRVPPPPE